MPWLYALLLAGSIAVPLALSFDRKLRFYRQWKFVLPSIIIIALFFILFDFLFTRARVWGFNPDYHFNLHLLGMPAEEWLFFILIPYASIFLHEALVLYFPRFRLGQRTTRWLTLLLIGMSVVIILFNFSNSYTVYNFSLLAVALFCSLFDKSGVIRPFYLTFLVILIPFTIVNGILTGSLIEGEVVWYNPGENLGIRILTIPVEDFGYGFSLILFNLLLIRRFQSGRTILKV